MPRSSSRPSRSTESPADKPATRKSLRAVASPSPKAKSSPAVAESRSRPKAKSTPTPAKSPSKAAKGKAAATTPEPKSATKSRSRSTSKKPAAKKASTSKSPAPKSRSSSKKSTGTPSAKTQSPAAASRSRSKSATKKAPVSPSPSPKKKSSPSPKKAKSKKSAAESSPKKSAKKTPQRGRSTGRRGKKDEEEERGDEQEVDKEQEQEAKQEQGDKPETEDTTDAKADEAKVDEETKVESAAAEAAAADAEKEIVTTEAEMLTGEAATADNAKPTEAMDTVESSPSRKRKRDEEEEGGDGDTDKTDGHDAKIIKLVDGDDASKSQADAPVEGNNAAGDAAAADADDDFILISTDEVPLADSEEMQQISAKMNAAAAPAAAPAAESEVCDGENGCHDDPLLSRTFIANPSISEPSGRTFSLVSYNILADYHARRDFTGASFITADQLAIPSRHKRLMQELDFLDADVICLQEVGGDYMADLLQPDMESRGYKGVFIPRNTKAYCEGEATFYRCSQFSLVDSQGLVLSDLIDAAVDESSGLEADKKELVKAALSTYAVAMLTKLKDNESDNTVTVANIHVAYDKYERQDRQCIQLATAVQKLIELAGGADKPHIICGDFNSWSGTAPYQLMTDGNLNDSSLVALQAIESIDAGEEQFVPVVNLWLDGFQLPIGGDLKSSYNTVTGAEPVTSRFSVDAGVLPLDYIWFSSVSLEILGVLKVVDTELIKMGIPTTVFPSDHLSIKAAFAFK